MSNIYWAHTDTLEWKNTTSLVWFIITEGYTDLVAVTALNPMVEFSSLNPYLDFMGRTLLAMVESSSIKPGISFSYKSPSLDSEKETS